MNEVHLRTPITKRQSGELKLGDTVFLSGLMYEMRGPAQVRALDYVRENKELPFSLENAVIAQTYSSSSRMDTGWKLNYLGISTSKYVQKYSVDMIKHFKISAMVGKGGMNKEALKAMKEFHCVYLAQVGGCGAIYGEQVERIREVFWEDLGLEKVLALELKDYGPLFVAIDHKGESLYEMVQEEVKRRLPQYDIF